MTQFGRWKGLAGNAWWPVGGHYNGDTICHKILHVGYYWPTFFKDTHAYLRKWKDCQTYLGREKRPSLPLQPISIEQPFEQWILVVIGEIFPNSSKQHRYILTATYYFTRWVKVIPLKVINFENVMDFID